MNKINQLYILFLVLVFTLATACSEGQKAENNSATMNSEAVAEEEFVMPDSATMMKNWETYMTPGEVHANLAEEVGTWTAQATMWMSPEAPPQNSTGKMEVKMILNGLYQESVYSSTVMGKPFEGRSVTGYDLHRKQIISTWIDNMGSGIMYSTGSYDPESKSITMIGDMVDPGTTQIVKMKQTIHIIDNSTRDMNMYMVNRDGSEFKTMNIRYTRD